MEHTLIDITEAARLTGLAKATLYRLASQRTLRSFKVLGTALRFDRADVLALVKEQPSVLGCDSTDRGDRGGRR